MVDFNIEEMHYYFDEQLKIADNSNYQELSVPQKDFLFNVAEEMYVKMIAFPLYNPLPKFELNDRLKNNIHTLVVNLNTPQQVSKFDTDVYIYKLPEDCRYFLGGSVIANNGACYKDIELFPITHEVISNNDYTIKSSFLWEEANYRFVENGIAIDADFVITGIKPVYIKKAKYMHNAKAYKKGNGSYKTLTGVLLTGTQNSQLPKNALLDIVNIAVLLLKADSGMSIDAQIAKIRDLN